MKINIKELKDDEKIKLVNARWASSDTVWDTIERTYKQNTAIYENKADWLQNIPHKRKPYTVQANRVFVNMEAVINSLIANPAGLNVLPARTGVENQEFARKLETFLQKKFSDLNVKEDIRMALRNLYFGRLLVIKPFWNTLIDDFDFRAIDPRNIRISKNAKDERGSDFAIEKIPDNLCSLIERFPAKKDELMKKFGITDEVQLFIKNPDVTYYESWINDYIIFSIENIVLDCIPNPYWDWEGIMITDEEEKELETLNGENRRQKLQDIKLEQGQRTQGDGYSKEEGKEGSMDAIKGSDGMYKPYFYNHFDAPRKPYIIATIFNNENTPIGRTDFISLVASLQMSVDKRKMDIDENCELVNGIVKVDSAVMGKSDAQRIRWETRGIIWGKGVKDGVTREVGTPLPAMVFDDMNDSRNEIDNIMAASSAFKGEREGQETKAGRLALIQQSYLRLNELVQVVDFVYKEMFNWSMQLAKTRYTERHYAKGLGQEDGQEVIDMIQDDFESGTEITIIAGKTLPKDDEFKFEQAQNDVLNGFISPVDYLEIAQYDNSKELAKNAVLYKQNPMEAVGIPQNEMPLPFQPGGLTPDQVASGGTPAEAPMEIPTETPMGMPEGL
jgi:hypothetical protein